MQHEYFSVIISGNIGIGILAGHEYITFVGISRKFGSNWWFRVCVLSTTTK